MQPDPENFTNSGAPSLQNPKLEETGRKCINCGETKSVTEFYKEPNSNKEGKVYYRTECKDCERAKKKVKDKLLSKMFGSSAKLKENRPYGTPCAICEKPMDKPIFDHCHETGEFRGWLCNGCNIGLGHLGDNLEGLMKAVRYLETTD